MTDETKTTETKQNKVKANGVKPDKSISLNYEIPMPPEEALECLTQWQREKRKNQNVTAVGFRVNGGALMVEVQPE